MKTLVLIILVSLLTVSCALGPLTSMDKDYEGGGRISKLNYTIHEKAADAELILKMEEKCPEGYKITEKGKRNYVFTSSLQGEVDYFDFKCTGVKRGAASAP
jgi:hypothetical protein